MHWQKGQQFPSKLPQRTANGAGVLEKVTKSVEDKVSLHFDMADTKQHRATLAANFYFISFLKIFLEA